MGLKEQWITQAKEEKKGRQKEEHRTWEWFLLLTLLSMVCKDRLLFLQY